MTDTPISAMTPEQATAKLAEMTAAYRGPPPTDKPTTAAEARARLNHLATAKSWNDKLSAGDVEATREFKALTAQVASDTAPYADRGEIVDAISNPSAVTRGKYDEMMEGLVEQGLPESGAQYIRDLDSGANKNYPTAGDGKAAQAALDRLKRDPTWAKAVLANDPKANAQRTRLAAVVSLARDDGKPITPAVAEWLEKLG